MKSFSSLSRPFIVGSLRQKTTDEIIDDIKQSMSDGAKAFILHIQLMENKCINSSSFKRIAESTDCPIMAINYRTEGGPDDHQRIQVMCEAVKAGFSSVDIPVYIFDDDPPGSLSLCDLPFASANPKEISMRPEVIQKQKELIKEFKALGAEVLMSAHVGVELTCQQVVSLALEMRWRGADIVKIVSSCNSNEQQLEILRGNLELKNVLDVPFMYTCYGPYNRFIRFNAPLFGTSFIFGHHSYGELSNREKPFIKNIKDYYEMGVIHEGCDYSK